MPGVQDILDCWLEHGELSTTARRQKARQLDRYKRTDRSERNPAVGGHPDPIECDHAWRVQNWESWLVQLHGV